MYDLNREMKSLILLLLLALPLFCDAGQKKKFPPKKIENPAALNTTAKVKWVFIKNLVACLGIDKKFKRDRETSFKRQMKENMVQRAARTSNVEYTDEMTIEDVRRAIREREETMEKFQEEQPPKHGKKVFRTFSERWSKRKENSENDKNPVLTRSSTYRSIEDVSPPDDYNLSKIANSLKRHGQ